MESIKDLIQRYQVVAKKSLGQNFLIDTGVVEDILDAAEITEDDLVLEIGPGLGSMTLEIAKRAGKVVAVELDEHLIPILNAYLFGYDVTVLHKDILKVNIAEEIIKPYGTKPDGTPYRLKVVSNLPYYITTPIIMKLLEDGIPAERMLFMVQLEVAERMCAGPGSKAYGALSVAIRYYSEPENLFTVPPHAFHPRPGVDSAVVRLAVRNKPQREDVDRVWFFKTVKAAFAQRRKTLVNSLTNAGYFSLTKEQYQEILAEMGLSADIRGEKLTIDGFSDLTNKIQEKCKGL